MTAPYTVELDPTPDRRQGEEQFVLHRPDGSDERITLHDYARVYAVPGLYEEVVQRRLECASPAVVADALVEAATARGDDPGRLRAFDVGAGNGVVGEELRARGVVPVVGADAVAQARDAAERDRPGLYAHYLVDTRLDGPPATDLVGAESLTALVAAGAVGEGHVPVDWLAGLWSAFGPGSYLALTLKDGGPESGDHDVADVDAMLAALPDTTVLVRRRFRHRLSMAGRELYYLVLCAARG